MSPHSRILLVEDDPDQADLFMQVLALAGYDVAWASSAEDAEARAREDGFTLAVVDWDLPGMNGDEFVRLLKASHPAIKTLLYSNHANVHEAAADSGADAWLRKSDGIRRLREMVAQLHAA